MIAYKFLSADRSGPLSGFAWPDVGVWVEASGPLAQCEAGVHVCRRHELAHWLAPTLWQVEGDAESLEGIDCLVVRRARLVREVVKWREGGAAALVEASLERVRAQYADAVADDPDLVDLLGDAVEAGASGYFAVAAYTAAIVGARALVEERGVAIERAYADERNWQSAWIAREVIGPL